VGGDEDDKDETSDEFIRWLGGFLAPIGRFKPCPSFTEGFRKMIVNCAKNA